MSDNKIINQWKRYFSNRGIEENLQVSYIEYIKILLSKNLPIIFETEHLALLLSRNEKYMNSVVYSPESHYREFKLKKRKGGFRTIDAPYPALLECQKWIQKNILSRVKINYCAHGFAKKKSIVTNAQIHIQQEQLLKIDLKDFFPSIKKGRVIAMFCNLGYPTEVSFYLASICCLQDCLPQGAPTSPTISNIISLSLDNRIFSFCKKFDLKYTRYADDLAISGKRIPTKFIEYLENIIQTESFEINNSKTQLHKGKGKRILTGVAINTDIIRAPKTYKRKLFQSLHYIEKYGMNAHMSKLKIRNPHYLETMIGKLHYILSIEKENNKAKKYLNMLVEIEKARTHNNVYN
jgi:RNA-directed DNA polymerase